MPLATDLELFTLPDLRNLDYTAHNEESRALWDAFKANAHPRVPIRLNTNPRVLMLSSTYNNRGITYEQYFNDPDLMAQVHLEWQYWVRHLLPGDQEKGLPDAWYVAVDFQNTYDAAWFGCPVEYRGGQVPDTVPMLDDARKRCLFDRGLPDPFEGEWPGRCLKYLEYYDRKSREGWTFMGRPVKPPQSVNYMGSDGIFTVAANLRGATELCMDLLDEPDYAHELLGYVTEALVSRMKAWREHFATSTLQDSLRFSAPAPEDNFWAADDTIELLSTEQYTEFVLPRHRQYYDAFGKDKVRGIHLCGDAQRHFPILRKELGIVEYDTGFPVDFARFRREMGPEVLISGGPPVACFVEEDPAMVKAETQRILESGILEGGRFILQEANNLPPQAKLSVCQAFYETGKRLGKVPA